MASNYDDIDVAWSWNGDLDIVGGDLADTSSNQIESLLQQVHDICASSLRDWENYPFRGAGLDDFIGEPNTQNSAIAIRDRLTLALTSGDVVNESDLAVRVIPVHIHRVLIVIGINAVATQYNSLDPGQKVITSLVFDTMEHQVTFLEKVPKLLPG